MTQEEELLLKDICGRLPYGVKVLYEGWDSDHDCEFNTVEDLIGIDDKFIYTLWRGEMDKHSIVEPLSIIDYKPYLRPLSSMTEEEKFELKQEHIKDQQLFAEVIVVLNNTEMRGKVIPHFASDWCNKNMFDFRGLIPKGLALSTEIYNPYKD